MTTTDEINDEARETWTNPEIVGQDVGGACRIVRALFDEVDRLRAEVDRLSKLAEIRLVDSEMAWRDCDDGSCRACAKCYDRLRAHNAALVEAAEEAAKVFDGYAAHHAAKSRTWTAVARAHNDAVMWQSAEESNDKADANAAHASRLRVAIAKVTP